MNDKHVHNWKTSDTPNRLECTKPNCNTMSDLAVALANAATDAAKEAKVRVLVTQLRNGDLRKSAREKAYGFVKSNGENVLVPEQESFI